MNSRTAGAALLAAVMVVGTAQAQDDDLAAGEKLYASQCKVCHGLVVASYGQSRPRPVAAAARAPGNAAVCGTNHARCPGRDDVRIERLDNDLGLAW